MDKRKTKRANNSVITAEDSSFQVGNEEPQEAHVVSNTGKQEVKANNPTDGTVTEPTNPTKNEEEATPTQEVKPINTQAIKIDLPHIDLSYKDNPSIANNKNGDADIAEYYNNQVEDVANQKDFFGVVQPVAQNKAETQATEETPQTTEGGDAVAQDTQEENKQPSPINPNATLIDKDVIELAKTMEGGLTYTNAKKALEIIQGKSAINASIPKTDLQGTFAESIKPKTPQEQLKEAIGTPEIKVPQPQATQEEEEKKQFGDDWLYEFSKVNPKPNVLADLGFHGFEKYNVPDNLLKLWGKDLTGAIDSITDENGNHLTDEQKKRIKRRIRGVRAGQALMQIANIATQAAAVSQGGTPVKMDNSSILGKIHNQAQAKQDAWLKQALKAKETANKNKMDMLNYQLDWMKALWDNQNNLEKNKLKAYELDLKLSQQQTDAEYKQGLLTQKDYSNQTARIKANNDALQNGNAQQKAEAQKEINLRKDYRILYYNDSKGQRRSMVVAYNDLQQMYSALGGETITDTPRSAYEISYDALGGQSKDKDFKLLAKVTQLINEKGVDAVKRYAINDKDRINEVYKAYGKKVTFSNGD